MISCQCCLWRATFSHGVGGGADLGRGETLGMLPLLAKVVLGSAPQRAKHD